MGHNQKPCVPQVWPVAIQAIWVGRILWPTDPKSANFYNYSTFQVPSFDLRHISVVFPCSCLTLWKVISTFPSTINSIHVISQVKIGGIFWICLVRPNRPI
jgi:hypothetical protein